MKRVIWFRDSVSALSFRLFLIDTVWWPVAAAGRSWHECAGKTKTSAGKKYSPKKEEGEILRLSRTILEFRTRAGSDKREPDDA